MHGIAVEVDRDGNIVGVFIQEDDGARDISAELARLLHHARSSPPKRKVP
jgi:fumarylacetoacetate (FAA) hydrolase family protein